MEQPGRLTLEQRAELQEAFDEFDTDGDRLMSTKELGWAMRAMGMNPTEAEILQLINKVRRLEYLELFAALWRVLKHFRSLTQGA